MIKFCEEKLQELIQLNTEMIGQIGEMEKEKLRIEGAYTAYSEMKEHLNELETRSDGGDGVSKETAGDTTAELEGANNEDKIQDTEPIVGSAGKSKRKPRN